MKLQVENMSKLLLCREITNNREENIHLLENACDRLFCVVSNNTYNCINVKVCKVKMDAEKLQEYILTIHHNENKKLSFKMPFVLNKLNLRLITKLALVRTLTDMMLNPLNIAMNSLEAESASVYL
jgi:hypothetical protein